MLKIGKLQLIHVKRNNASHHRKKQGCWRKQGAWDLALVEEGRSKGIIIGTHLPSGYRECAQDATSTLQPSE